MWPFTKKSVLKLNDRRRLDEFIREGSIFVFGYVPDYVQKFAGDYAVKITEDSILEKGQALADDDFGKNLLLLITKGSQDFSDSSMNAYVQQYEEYCKTFERTTGGNAYASYITWGPFSSRGSSQAMEKIHWPSYTSSVNFDALALLNSSHYCLPYDIFIKTEYLYMIDHHTSQLDSKVFTETIKEIVMNTTKPKWDKNYYIMPVENKKAWKNNMQVFHLFLNEPIIPLRKK